MDNDLYVYQHRRNDTGQVFYIGKGSGDRSEDVRKRKNDHWRHIVNKHGHTVEIVCDKIDEKHAFELEVMLIAFYGRRDIGTGFLVNMTDGGEGVRGRIMPPVSDETRAKLSSANRGKKKSPEHVAKMSASRIGWRPTAETRAKISTANKGRKQTADHVEKRAAAIRGEKSPMWGKALSQETRDKISTAQAGRPLTLEWSANIAAGKRGISRSGGSNLFCGVSRVGEKWRARITDPKGGRVSLGLYLVEEDAARAYDAAARNLYGPTARVNFPEREAL